MTLSVLRVSGAVAVGGAEAHLLDLAAAARRSGLAGAAFVDGKAARGGGGLMWYNGSAFKKTTQIFTA